MKNEMISHFWKTRDCIRWATHTTRPLDSSHWPQPHAARTNSHVRTMPFPSSLWLFLLLAVTAAVVVYFNGVPTRSGRNLEATVGGVVDLKIISAEADCIHDGTCEASDMYKEKDVEEEVETVGKVDKEGSDEMEIEGEGKEEVETLSKVQEEDSCIDEKERCEEWASMGECEKNPAYMKLRCRKSCLICGEVEIDMGVEQTIKANLAQEIERRLADAKEYMIRDFGRDPKKKRLLELCKNKHADCAIWSVQGECEANPAFMNVSLLLSDSIS